MGRCPDCDRELLDPHIPCVHKFDKYTVHYFCSGKSLSAETCVMEGSSILMLFYKLIPIKDEKRIKSLLLLK